LALSSILGDGVVVDVGVGVGVGVVVLVSLFFAGLPQPINKRVTLKNSTRLIVSPYLVVVKSCVATAPLQK